MWGEAYSYDGFGNLTGKTVTQAPVPAMGVSYDANNHQRGLTYDANGNHTRPVTDQTGDDQTGDDQTGDDQTGDRPDR